ncbi:THAP domain-containing protein 5 [Poecilia latipinna]|uniref:THAP domain-containing protein 5 n=1 Tax=Poecilia latipinna TaxID=48699 RepID=UPI00072E7C3D|nr:PREDICTED: THAP domain-containing protein 5 [Poecilia latipinna]XP_014901096.1 PREDICTED: THAP domain-containing protein 5 [Poecilia latipinna]XP_014901097.1 PREDICTED: THAP domain-containing protein 5 [Poecilia latipinna]
MPRYCAEKLCRNRGGTSSKQDKKISFYPFPLQDRPRLQKWVNNMRREEWTPSRHQYLCSEHFTEDCFDIRWGIRYLRNTAIPTLFPSVENECENKVTLQRSPEATSLSQAEDFECDTSRMPLILRKMRLPVKEQSTMLLKVPLFQESRITSQSSLPETHTTVCEVTDDSGVSAVPCLTPPACSEEQTDSIVTVLCCEAPGPFSGDEEHAPCASFAADQSQTFRFVPVELISDRSLGSFAEEAEAEPGDREHVLVHEHSYCRADTDKDELWSKILSLHAKILELDRREESTVAKIQTLENEIALLRRDGAVFKEKQKILEDYISSVLL